MKNKKASCLIFDLDDTLYKERDYQISGFQAVSDYCLSIYGRDVFEKIIQWDQQGKLDVFSLICEELSIPKACKISFIWAYRNHYPKLSLHPKVSRTIDQLKKNSHPIAIVTDGRSGTQRQKVNALGLSHLPVYISEEWNDSKPGQIRFEAIQKKFNANDFWYIGDNPKKDFVAPNKLGWKTVGLRGDEHNIHSQDISSLYEDYLPDFWVSSLDELLDTV